VAEARKDFRARHRYARMSSRKIGLVLELVRRRPVNEALATLRFTSKRAARLVEKVIASAMANAGQSGDVDLNRLVVASAVANEGPLLGGRRRWRAGSLGRAFPIRRRTSHIEVRLELGPEGAGPGPRGRRAARVQPADAPGAASESERESRAAVRSGSKGGRKAERTAERKES
jgi:large subunit ribosomal protein L22